VVSQQSQSGSGSVSVSNPTGTLDVVFQNLSGAAQTIGFPPAPSGSTFPALTTLVGGLQAVRALRRLAATLAWTPTDENIAPPDSGGLFHTARLATATK